MALPLRGGRLLLELFHFTRLLVLSSLLRRSLSRWAAGSARASRFPCRYDKMTLTVSAAARTHARSAPLDMSISGSIVFASPKPKTKNKPTTSPTSLPPCSRTSPCASSPPTGRETMEGAVLCAANHAPLTPLSFLERSALVYPDRPAVLAAAGDAPPRTWRETRARCLRLAAALAGLGVQRRHVVAVFAQNVPAMCELHFAVPMAGAVICALNSRLDAAMASVLLRHSEARVLFVDAALLGVAREALRLLSDAGATPPAVVLIRELLDGCDDGSTSSFSGATGTVYEYEALVSGGGSPEFAVRWPEDENEPIALNYTSGTTSRPKGVIYTHRGAYLNSLASVLLNDMPSMPVYLWTVPMFHCNGWCMAWGVAAQGGTNVCLRKVTGAAIFDAVSRHGVTHMGGAPTVLGMIVHAAPEERRPLPAGRKVAVMTGGAPPPPAVLFRMEELGFLVIHSYGLTETYGPATVCTWKPEWDALPADERAAIKSRQGLHHLGLEVDVKDPATMRSVPADGATMGEVMFRGNTVMSGYYKDAAATAEALAGGWFRSGDLAVRVPGDGYVKIRDRSKDIIISGGENISTIEVEAALFAHPAVAEAAVVGRPDEHWGETPCAFVVAKKGERVEPEEVVAFCRGRLPRYMAPRTVVVVEELPKTATGKVQKFALRDKAKAMGSLSTSKL
ncbi:butanoate--CoA ligase AAE1-like isoform X1 [Triticum aestivum]|uniref:butanoate--CoA ligase AAE1-like isoform X1 n=1 Tax=Triticum aestivum TaxID=4565 RepID=UPI0008424C08|nr:butanoate--CoA ligase AAE1-like isoform X1 [Triticum aestivum]